MKMKPNKCIYVLLYLSLFLFWWFSTIATQRRGFHILGFLFGTFNISVLFVFVFIYFINLGFLFIDFYFLFIFG